MRYMSILLLIALLSLALPVNVSAQDDQQKAWMEYMTPGEVHKMMAQGTGEWKTTSKFYMGEGEPTVSEGKSVVEMILGGRYLQSKYTGTAWGMQVEGLLLMGYDNATNEYTSVWIDNLGTGTSIAKGKRDPATNNLILNGTMVEPETKQEMAYKEIYKFTDENHYSTEMYTTQNGKEVKIMEINFSR